MDAGEYSGWSAARNSNNFHAALRRTSKKHVFSESEKYVILLKNGGSENASTYNA